MRLLRFTADWCPACKRFAPIIEGFAEKHGIDLVTVDVEQEPDVAERYSVQSLPTLVVVDDAGEPVRSLQGAMPSPVLANELREYLS